MFVYRASNLAKGKLKDTTIPTLAGHIGAVKRSQFHALYSRKHEGQGKYLEQDQVVFLTEETETAAPILGIITSTPDMYYVKHTTLYVEEWKTITPKSWAQQKGRCKAEWSNQGLLYCYNTNLNLPVRRNYIVLKIRVWVREETVEETAEKKPTAEFTETLTWGEVKEKTEAYLERVLKKKWNIVPFSNAVLAPKPKLGLDVNLRGSFCYACSRLFWKDEKKYLVSSFYLCHMCFYTSATQAEFREVADKIMKKLKLSNYGI